MSAHQSTHWFWSDWAGDLAVRSLTPAERGLWMDLLTLAAFGNPTGYVVDARGIALPLERIAHFANCPSTAECKSLIDGILAKGCASQDRDGRLFNRRMVRDTELSVKKRRAGKLGAAATALRWQALNGVPGHLPGHVPRHTGTRALPSKIITSNLSGAARAREGALDGTAPQKTESGSATVPGAKPRAEPTSELAASIQNKGWASQPTPVRAGVDDCDDLAEAIKKRGWI